MVVDNYQFFIQEELLPFGFAYPKEYINFTKNILPDLQSMELLLFI